MSTIINGSSPSVTFSDGTTQTSGYQSGSQFGASQMPTGSVIQVVTSILSPSVSGTNTTYSDALTATITPQFSTSKILIICNVNGIAGGTATTAGVVDLAIRDNSSNVIQTFVGNGFNPNNNAPYLYGAASINLLHSPSTTSAYTYRLSIKSNTNNAQGWELSDNGYAGQISATTLTLLEIR